MPGDRTTEVPLPGPRGAAGRAGDAGARHWSTRPHKRLMLFAGRSNPRARRRHRRAARHRARRDHAEDVRERRDVLRYEESIRGADLFLVQTGLRAGRPEPDGAADHDPGREARLGQADHGRHPVVPVLAPGQEVGAARADHGQARRRLPPHGRRRPRADDGPPRRPDPGLLRHPGRPHDRAAALRAALPRPGPERRGRRLRRAGRRPREDGREVRADGRRRLRDHAQDAAGARRRGDHRGDRQRPRQGRASSATT